ncbi:hypothetical protein NIES267_70650 [Calothrix parasitica NIES-267]|uniref:Uncharacterized protein n=1 Tax=Calothrix parasitica NIES-267 TaxID=1973488 RepID=A0A1Z4M2A8_9CYAN|nr:hypothetical protein NIES267_70650 [Calothrix parasitica NIES-267]
MIFTMDSFFSSLYALLSYYDGHRGFSQIMLNSFEWGIVNETKLFND